MARLVPSLLDQAGKDNLTLLAILHRLADDERASRMKSVIDRRIKDARFPKVNTIDGFDFDFDAVCKKLRARYLALHDLSNHRPTGPCALNSLDHMAGCRTRSPPGVATRAVEHYELDAVRRHNRR